MLWEKELNEKGGLYVNFFEMIDRGTLENQHKKDCDTLKREVDETTYVKCKNDKSSLSYRQDGNSWFAKKQLDVAMRNYNVSLCAAENDSNHIALSFANRAKCYLHLKRYENCLVDIELAKKANYPNISKLEQTKANCLKMMKEEEGPPKDYEEKLSYPPNAQLPGLAKVLQLEVNPEHGRHVKSTADIDVGKTILLERMYFGAAFVTRFEVCAVCLKCNNNLIPCTKCTFSMLCYDSSECKNAHDSECGILEHPVFAEATDVGVLLPIIRSIWMASDLFPNTNDLMEFVEAAVTSDKYEIPSFADEKSKYRAFLKISTQYDHLYVNSFYQVYKKLMSQPIIASRFKDDKHQRFLMHLIRHHSRIVLSKMLVDKVAFIIEATGAIRLRASNFSVSITKTYFNHSCYPNIILYPDNGSVIGKVIRPIKEGEQLFVSYHPCTKALTEKRQSLIQETQNFLCQCERCCDRLSDTRSIRELASDPLYQSIERDFASKQPVIMNFYEESDRKVWEERACALLKKYGRYPYCCKEIELMMDIYVRSLMRWTSAPLNKFHFIAGIVYMENNPIIYGWN